MTIQFQLIIVCILFSLKCVTSQHPDAERAAVKKWWQLMQLTSLTNGNPEAWLHVDFESGIHIWRYGVYDTKYLTKVPYIMPPFYAPDNKGDFYCAMMIDNTAGKDVLLEESLAPMVLWLHLNMRGVVPIFGDTVIEYTQPVSMPHQTMHLVMVMVFKQKQYMEWKRRKIKKKDKPVLRAKFDVQNFVKQYTYSFECTTFFRIDFDTGGYNIYKEKGHPCDIECARNYTSDEGTYYGRGDNIYKAIWPLYSRNKDYDISQHPAVSGKK